MKNTPIDQVLLNKVVRRGIKMQHKFKAEPLFKYTGKGSFDGDFVTEMKEAKSKFPTKK